MGKVGASPEALPYNPHLPNQQDQKILLHFFQHLNTRRSSFHTSWRTQAKTKAMEMIGPGVFHIYKTLLSFFGEVEKLRYRCDN